MDRKQELRNEIARLEAQQLHEAHSIVMGLLSNYAALMTEQQREDLRRLMRMSPKTDVLVKRAPKFKLPHNGEMWHGRGRLPAAFKAWEGTVACREWRAANPGRKWPPYRGLI